MTSLTEKPTISQRETARRMPRSEGGAVTGAVVMVSDLDSCSHRLRQGPYPGTRQGGEARGERNAPGEPPARGHGGDDERRHELHAAGEVHDHGHRGAPHPGRKQLRE